MDRMLATADARPADAGPSARGVSLKVLSLSLVYPNPAEPGLGPFVQARLQHVAACADLKVVAPVPVIDYSGPNGKFGACRSVPSRRQDNGVDVLHPRWLYPPGGTPLNVLCLALRLAWTFTGLRRTFPFQIIDAHFGYPGGVAAALLAKWFGCAFIVTLRGSEIKFAAYRYRRLCMGWALRRAGAIIAVSSALRQLAIEAGADRARVVSIPNGVDGQIFRPRGKDACRAKFDVKAGTRVIVCAGELMEAKGHHLVIRALDSLVKEGVNAELFIAGGVARGGRPFDKELSGLVAGLQLERRVHRLGWLQPDDLADLMSAADVFCLASFSEGWPNVVQEALACGTPVVASNVGAVAQMISAGEHGFVVPARDQGALNDALKAALSHPWNRTAIAEWGQRRSWDQVALEVMDVMERVAAETRVRN